MRIKLFIITLILFTISTLQARVYFRITTSKTLSNTPRVHRLWINCRNPLGIIPSENIELEYKVEGAELEKHPDKYFFYLKPTQRNVSITISSKGKVLQTYSLFASQPYRPNVTPVYSLQNRRIGKDIKREDIHKLTLKAWFSQSYTKDLGEELHYETSKFLIHLSRRSKKILSISSYDQLSFLQQKARVGDQIIIEVLETKSYQENDLVDTNPFNYTPMTMDIK